MNIDIEWHNDQFNVNLASKPGAEAFLSIKGCRIVNGAKGDFISYPARKNEQTGKYWNHVWASDAFNRAVLEKAQASAPKAPAKSRQAEEFDDSSIPF
jgi:DNA-binding cell septation regulator SpoVG